MPKVNLVITAWNEVKTTAKIIETVISNYSYELENLRIILVCPDVETADSAQKIALELNFDNLTVLKDERKGKPIALNMAFEEIRRQFVTLDNLDQKNTLGLEDSITICTDGDVVLEPDSINLVVKKLLENNYLAVTARPKSIDSKDNFWGYVGNMLADGADVRRTQLSENGDFLFLSGYLLGFQSKVLESITVPENCLVDDAFLSIAINNLEFSNTLSSQKSNTGYCRESVVGVKYPNNYKDWILQKKRSVGGYRQLKNFFPKQNKLTQSRLWDELKFILFPLKYAKTETEFFYSLFFYFLRLDLWIRIFLDNFSKNKSMEQTWQRVESTK